MILDGGEECSDVEWHPSPQMNRLNAQEGLVVGSLAKLLACPRNEMKGDAHHQERINALEDGKEQPRQGG